MEDLYNQDKTVGKGQNNFSKHCSQIFAIDLVDLNQHISVKTNKRYRCILSIICIFWLLLVQTNFLKTPDILTVFLGAVAETGDHLCSQTLSNNGAEFQGELECLLKTNGIKHTNTKSCTPEPHIESKSENSRFRKIIH